MAETVSLTIRGKTYRVSAQESTEHIKEAARLFEEAFEEVSRTVLMAREEQIMLFAGLQAAVGLIKERDAHAEALTAHATRLEDALKDVVA